jgi:hypothetical protein
MPAVSRGPVFRRPATMGVRLGEAEGRRVTATGRHARGLMRCLRAAPALAAGGLGCLGAQLLTGRLLAHSHDTARGVGAAVPHVHDRAAAAALVVGSLLLVSLLAAVAAAGRRGATRAAVMWAGAVSSIAFVGIDRVPHGADAPAQPSPALLLLAGIAVHVCVGAAAGLLCWRWLEGVRPPAARPRLDRPSPPRRVPPERRHARLLRRWWAAAVAGRAPPCRFA